MTRAVQRSPVAGRKRPLRGASPQRSRSLVVTTPTSCECSPLRSRRTDRAGSEDPSNAGNRRAQKRRVSKPSLVSLCSRNAFVAFPLWLPSSLCVERSEFCVSIQHKKSQKQPSALKSAYQDKKFRKAHKWHLRHCFLKVLRQVPTQLLSPQKKTPEVPTPQRSRSLVVTPLPSSRCSSVRSRRTVSSGTGRLLTRCQVPNDSQGHHQVDTRVPDHRRRRHSNQHTPMKKGAFIAPFASDLMGHRTSLIHQVLSGSELFL